MEGRSVNISGPRSAIRAGIGFVSDDRINEGLLTNLTVRENLGLAVLSRWARSGFVQRRSENRGVARLESLLGIKAPSMEAPIETLSGGNQQRSSSQGGLPQACASWCSSTRLLASTSELA